MLIEVTEPTQTGEARRKAVALASELRMGETLRGEVALATTEIATNILKHAKSGHILLQALQNGHVGLRVMGVDKGPGISDIPRALSDGHSTAGSMGTGLGAIKRVASAFDLYSQPGSGTIISAEFWSSKTGESPLEVGVVSEPLAGEEECGDSWGTRVLAGNFLLMVADGLGHGILASEAAREAERILAAARDDSPYNYIQDVHPALRKTRGAAAAIARIDPEKRVLSFAGVGNISASIVSPGSSRGLASHNGTLGQHMPRVQEFAVPWNPESILIMHSDGLSSRWDLERYPGIWAKHPSMIAALLHRDFRRTRDDVTVLVAKAA